MTPALPFDPIQRAAEMEAIVMHDQKRKYYRFRASRHYGGIVTADAVGCPFLCAYCWNYARNASPERFGKYYAADEVVEKLTSIASRKSIRLFRISGAEPVLGPVSFDHLLQVVEAGRFIIETNGLVLGARPHLAERLGGLNVAVRIGIKGWDPQSFERISGAKKEFFRYPLIALKTLREAGVDAWPAVMGDLFLTEGTRCIAALIEEMGIRTRIETEYLERYPGVMSAMRHRGC
ncbi:MAG: radical SAM protein [Methanoregula sp.]|nr:radical SAM protein [Methanoregula sp.]